MPRMQQLLACAFAAVLSVAAVAAETGAFWSNATLTNPADGRAIEYRYVKEFAPGFEPSSMPARFTFVWHYESANGMPSASERESMQRLEDLLSSRLTSTGSAALVLVSTGENVRRWIYYAKSQEVFLVQLNLALAQAPRFPMEMHAADDREWSSYKAFRQALQE